MIMTVTPNEAYHINAEVIHPQGTPTDYSAKSYTREDIARELAALTDDTEAN